MEHRKCYHAQIIPHEERVVVVEGPIKPETLRTLSMHADLNAFRRPQEQHQALVEIAELPEGRIIIAREGQMIVGYVTFHYPDELERWSEGNMEDLIELGAIEVANDYRSLGLGKKLIITAFEDDQMESYIVFTTEYYWHWDMEGTGLSVWDYRKMMEKLMQSVGMIWYATDDPEICAHPANCLMVRIGKDVPLDSKEQFDRVRFRQRFMY
ncbi:GNAT family N-acetyltransferase [Paenibacillus apiarius]|uniref:GNAT family N-acetyltransferase n=1 Tax=Paenibacillus apiarius TaxID=46240 RepID=A0ABT4DLU7_9BACL|nr:GNAT family N-acetyltransferase [Paenibacillus apiarius]MBN3526034.1 GNAT family N-acetyltransferase [Paenibacillus apiarius]MCY9513659.1 GNAT family N-acetyltransferase [Paenibacillus apiarius]MCY9518210.1 GNAT family N-acetyltransferase [Paenibacillus apiarius]MCY9551389.1 GNAT family N-acetyltransferase [Paenibacillus apiarius]MCY9558543.1 GNAT family N-acetyltransferase [Paenibacillus apiarius]